MHFAGQRVAKFASAKIKPRIEEIATFITKNGGLKSFNI